MCRPLGGGSADVSGARPCPDLPGISQRAGDRRRSAGGARDLPRDVSGPIPSPLRSRQAGHPVVGAKEVQLRFTPGSTDVPPMEAVLVELGEGRYSGRGTYLSLPDRWQVQVAVRREGTFDTFADLTVDLRPAEAALNLPWPRVTGALLAAAGVLAWAAIQRTQVGLPAQVFRAIPAVALSMVGVAVLARPLPAGNLHQSGPTFLRLGRRR